MEMRDEHKEWKKEKEEEIISFKEIMESQNKEKIDLTKQIVKVLS